MKDRNEVKILTMVLFFGKESTIKLFRTKFKNEFPLVYETIKNLKKENNKSLANNLMKMKREIMIDTVANNLIHENEKMMLLTIHDGILTTEDFADKTKTRIQQTIQNRVGIIPKVKVKLLKE